MDAKSFSTVVRSHTSPAWVSGKSNAIKAPDSGHTYKSLSDKNCISVQRSAFQWSCSNRASIVANATSEELKVRNLYLKLSRASKAFVNLASIAMSKM